MNIQSSQPPLDPNNNNPINKVLNTSQANAKKVRIIANRYELVSMINRDEAAKINQATGIPIVEVASENEASLQKIHRTCIAFVRGGTEASTVLGGGFFGTFYLARRLNDQTYVGVKEIVNSSKVVQSKFEALLQKKVAHIPYVMPLYDYEESLSSDETGQQALYQFMPLAGLGNVSQLRLHLNELNDPRLKYLIILHIAKNLLLGLWHLHRMNIYHLDIKPDNLVVDLEGKIYLIDFGCAVEMKEGKSLIYHQNEEGVRIGKGDLDYCTPVRADALKNITKASFNCEKEDLYAAGLSLLELIVGKYAREMNPEEKEGHILQELGIHEPYKQNYSQLVQALVSDVKDYPTAEDVLKLPMFQHHEIHRSDSMEVALNYLKKFVEQTTFYFKSKVADSSIDERNQLNMDNYQAGVDKISENRSALSGEHGYEVPLIKEKTTFPTDSGEHSYEVPLIKEKTTVPTDFVNQKKDMTLVKEYERPPLPLLQHLQKKNQLFAPSLYINLYCSRDRQGTNPTKLEDAVNQWLRSDSIVLLLLADGGSGKSTFCQYFAQQQMKKIMSEANDTNNNNAQLQWLPLYIPLNDIRDPKNLLEEVLRERYGSTSEEIAYLKKHQRFLLIFDGYDEMNKATNLFVENDWQNDQVKMLITCRPSVLESKYDIHFLPYQQEQQAASLFEEFFVLPFSSDEISQYIEAYFKEEQLKLTQAVQRGELQQEWLSVEKYQSAIKEIPQLNDLIKNPFLLRLTINVLPRLFKQKEDIQCIKAIGIYEEFIIKWMEEQIAKETKSPLTSSISFETVWDFGQRFAEKLYEAGEFQHHFATSWRFDSQIGNFVEDADSWGVFLGDKSPQAKVMRQRLPLKEYREQTYGFIHASILEYLSARKWYFELKTVDFLEPESLKSTALNRYPLCHQDKNRAKLQFLSEWVSVDIAFKNALFTALKNSKQEFEFIAANAITILNLAKVPFSSVDLHEVNISHADLRDGIFDHTDFSNANLSHVKLTDAWIRKANFTAANFSEVDLGEQPCLKHEESVEHAIYSPDGLLIATASGTTVYLWNVKNSKLKLKIQGVTKVKGLAFSPNSKILASSCGNDILLYNVLNGTKLKTLHGHTDSVNSVAFNSDGTLMASGSDDFMIRIWNVNTGKELSVLKGHEGIVSTVAFHPRNIALLASGSQDYTIRLWNVQEKKFLSSCNAHERIVNSLSYSSDGKWLASASWDKDKTVKIWDATDVTMLKERNVLKHASEVKSVTFSPDDTKVITGSTDFTVQVWDVRYGEKLRTFQGHTEWLTSVVIHPTDKIIASASRDTTVRFWDMMSTERSKLEGHTHWVNSVIFGNPKVAISGGVDKTIRFWDVSNGEELQRLSGYSKPILALAISSNGNWLAIAGMDDCVLLRNLITKQEYKLEEHHSPVKSIAFSADGKKLVSGSTDKTIILWDVENRKKIMTFQGHGDKVTSVALSPKNDFLVSGSWDKSVCVWDVSSGNKRYTFDGHQDKVTGVVIHPKGEILASCSWDKMIKLWDLKTKKEKYTFQGHGDRVTSIAFNQDGTKLASASMDNTVRIWNTSNNQCLAILKGYFGSVESVAWSTKDELITGSADHSIKCWRSSEQPNKEIIWQLVWSTHSSLFAGGCILDQATGLSSLNYQLLQQRGATGKPIIQSQENTVPKKFTFSGFLQNSGLMKSN